MAVLGKKMLPAKLAKLVEDHPIPAMMCVFACNLFSAQLLNTGAFEVTYNGEQVWSKMETGRFPQMEELKEALSAVAYAKPAVTAM